MPIDDGGWHSWYGISVDSSNHNVYVTDSSGAIYKQTAGTGNFVSLGQARPTSGWVDISVDSSNHDVYAVDMGGDIYKYTPCNTSVNTPPTITLIGANPLTLTIGTPFTNPGATANDKEDGNITNKIIITGTVDTTAVGTTTLIYSVTDSGGLSASTTRQVIVNSSQNTYCPDGRIDQCHIDNGLHSQITELHGSNRFLLWSRFYISA